MIRASSIKKIVWLSCALLLVVFFAASLARTLEASSSPTSAWLPLSTIHGTVVNAQGPVAGATVRIQLTDSVTKTSEDGTFSLTTFTPKVTSATQPITLTAWAAGHYIGWATALGNSQPVTITLNAHYKTDNVEYDWFTENGIDGSAACGECHTANAEWTQDAHSKSATNFRFLTLYAGTDVHGNQSPLSRIDGKSGVYLPPDPNEPYYGPGFKLDNPNRTGVCATCHTPAAAKIPTNNGCGWQGCHTSYTASVSELIPDGASPLGLKGDAAEGISCEFCHKIANVQINRKTGTPYDDSPGILSLMLLRPQAGEDLFFGPFDDVVRTDIPTARDAYQPLQKESQFCAACHYGVMGGVVANMQVTGGVLVYSSFKEWSDSYKAGQTTQTCQGCHMPVGDHSYFVFPEKGGQVRDPNEIHNHHMLGKEDSTFMQNAVSMTATAQLNSKSLLVSVDLLNDKTGHAVPTDSVMHHVMLLVTAKDKNGKVLALQNGSTLPDWAGNYAGQAGKMFAKVLRDTWTGEVPSAAFWRPVEEVSDTRLAPFVPDRSQFRFTAPQDAATVEVKLIYRRAPQQLMEQKGWNDPDVVMKQTSIQVKSQ